MTSDQMSSILPSELFVQLKLSQSCYAFRCKLPNQFQQRSLIHLIKMGKGRLVSVGLLTDASIDSQIFSEWQIA